MKKEEIIAGLEVLCLYDDVLSCEYGQLSQKEVCTEAIKALKQYGALQDIRKEIAQELQDYSQYAKDGEDYYLGICTGCDDAMAIIDKYIKEIEG